MGNWPWWVYYGYGFARALQVLLGRPVWEEFGQDWTGARGLVFGEPVYSALQTTHPPTSFVLAAPFAWLPYNVAQQFWLVLMLMILPLVGFGYAVSARRMVLLLPLALLWPPVIWGLHNLTIVWLVALSLAWRWRAHGGLAGAAVGVAAATKGLAVVSMVPLVRRYGRRPIAGLALTGLVLCLPLLLRPELVSDYFTYGRASAEFWLSRPENGALLVVAAREFGWLGIVGVAVLLAAVARRGACEGLSMRGWWCWSWIGVALLPIAWGYSLVPLLPGLAWGLWRGTAWERLFALAAVVMTVAFPTPNIGAPVAVALALAGVALFVGGHGVMADVFMLNDERWQRVLGLVSSVRRSPSRSPWANR